MEQKYQFYIDFISQKSSVTTRHLAKKLDPYHYNLFKDSDNIDSLVRYIEEYTFNSYNEKFKDFCVENNISNYIYDRVVSFYPKIIIAYWDVVDINNIPSETKLFDATIPFVADYLDELNSKNVPYFIKIRNQKTFERFESHINLGKDMIVSNLLLKNNLSKIQELELKNIRYRLYLDERVLTERIIAKDVFSEKVICEECFLDINNTSKITLVTDQHLAITKVKKNNEIIEVNNTEFILNP